MGDVGPAARAFVTRLGAAGQRLWQILPLSPTDGTGSPYAGGSAFAADPLLISLDDLIDDGLLREDEPDVRAFLDAVAPCQGRVDPALQRGHKLALVRTAARRLLEGGVVPDEPSRGILDWAEFIAPRAGTSVDVEIAVQALFDRQWERLRTAAQEAGVAIIGDLPIFVGSDSADVAAHPELFLLDKEGRPDVVAGCPPDFFSPLGQRWGNPHYDWDAARAEDFRWWRARLLSLLERVDVVRVDHFRGFAAAWAIPVDAPDARTGEWSPAPGVELFTALQDSIERAGRLRDGRLPLIAEDLGLITPDVEALRDRFELPGMKILQFGFDGDPDHPFLPPNYPERCVAYTGTHDNETIRGWYEGADEATRHHARVHLSVDGSDIAWDCIGAVLHSKAETAIVPVQDLLNLGNEARFNTPGTAFGNWSWRMRDGALTDALLDRLATLTSDCGR
jgi:4-alpha-glucanotransferase